jgi:two-component system LytT family response regulator
MDKLRVVIADDERPARMFLRTMLQDFDWVQVVGEAENGIQAVEIIKDVKPDLALLDLQMPELDGFGVVKNLRKTHLPLVAFVTAYDEYAVQAFEVNAIDYLLKPVERIRLLETIQRVAQRLEEADAREKEAEKLKAVADIYEEATRLGSLERIPVKQKDEIMLIPVSEVASVVADGELLHITTNENQRYIINYRLKDLESRLSPNQFVRLSRGAIANVDMISKINPMPGGTYVIRLKNKQELSVSRLQSKMLREKFLRM